MRKLRVLSNLYGPISNKNHDSFSKYLSNYAIKNSQKKQQKQVAKSTFKNLIFEW